MSGGAIMISDMFNNVLKARVDALRNELSALVRNEHGIAAAGSFQSQSQGKPTELNAGLSSLLAPETSERSNWWPAGLRAPSSVGAQNNVRYAYFPAERRLVVDLKGKVIRHAGSPDWRILSATAGIGLSEFCEPARPR
jgi:hypothetical protein